MDGIKIGETKKDIQIPGLARNGRPKSEIRLKADSLNVGESFDVVIDDEKDLLLVTKKMRVLCIVFRKTTDKRFVVRTVDRKTMRMWRSQ
jgi:hypothetical protein